MLETYIVIYCHIVDILKIFWLFIEYCAIWKPQPNLVEISWMGKTNNGSLWKP